MIALAYSEIPSTIRNGKWEYVHFLRVDVDPNKVDWTKAYYEIMKSPSQDHLEPTFSTVEYRYWEDREKSVKDGSIILVGMPDGSSLYLAFMLTKADQEYIRERFGTKDGGAMLSPFSRGLSASWPPCRFDYVRVDALMGCERV